MNNIVYVAPADDWLSHFILRSHQWEEFICLGILGICAALMMTIVLFVVLVLLWGMAASRIHKFFKLRGKK